jgi:hypothetical protein
MAAPKGNKYWEFRNKHGRDYKYTPDALWDEAIEYFKWIDDNPIKANQNLGTRNVNEVKFKRPYTLIGFCLFADISTDTFYSYKKNKDFIAITHKIENIIYNQKFEGATIGIFKEQIIIRELGLKEQSEIEEIKKDYSKLSYKELYKLKYGKYPDE